MNTKNKNIYETHKSHKKLSHRIHTVYSQSNRTKTNHASYGEVEHCSQIKTISRLNNKNRSFFF